jgi:DNA-binding response OmpR family regulator
MCDPRPQSTVLVVDDDDDVRSLVVLHLEMSGYKCAEAATVEAGLAALAADAPDAVVTDLNFGDDTGERIVRRCTDIGQPVVLMTASVDTRDLAADLRARVTILRKPFVLSELTSAIAAVLAGRDPS